MSKRKRPPIVKHWRLEFNQYDLVCCVAETINEGLQVVGKNYNGLKDLLHMESSDSTRARMLGVSGMGCILLFRYDKLYGNILCHEAVHATNFFMQQMGVTLSDSSDEAFAYYTDMVFRFVAQWWEAQGLKPEMSTPFVPEMIYQP
jgi:hypothetical protein